MSTFLYFFVKPLLVSIHILAVSLYVYIPWLNGSLIPGIDWGKYNVSVLGDFNIKVTLSNCDYSVTSFRDCGPFNILKHLPATLFYKRTPTYGCISWKLQRFTDGFHNFPGKSKQLKYDISDWSWVAHT